MEKLKKIKNSIVFKSLAGVIILLIIFSIVVSIIGYEGVTAVLLEQYADGAFRTARSAAETVNPDHIDDMLESEGHSLEYQRSYEQMQHLCNTQGVTFIYVIIPDVTDYGHITFLISTINENVHYTKYPFGYVRETTNDDYREKYRLLYEGKSDQELVIRDRGYIETDPHITAMIPLKDSNGQTRGILCVQRQMDGLVTGRRSFVIKVFLAMTVLVIVIIIIEGLFLSKTILYPLTKISEEAERFARENVAAETKLKVFIRTDDEVGILASSIDQMEEQVQEYMEDLTRITAEKQKISTEMQLASRIQNGMLPDSSPAFPDRHEFDVFGVMDPAREVGGDFFDYFLIDEDHLCIMIADVSGKGVPAALFMMSSKIILINNALAGGSPAETLEQSNAMLCRKNVGDMFVTVWVGVLEISTGRLTAASAGHEYPVLKEAGGKFELVKDRRGFVLGGMEGSKYKEYEILLTPGAKLFVYTDGLPEATDANNQMFGIDRMIEALNTTPEAPVMDVMENVLIAVSSFVGDEEQFDDLTMVCLEYCGNNPEK